MSSAKPHICFLLALWGKSYIETFCDISLRSLLAEGNIPALAKEYSCIFTLLTTREDIAGFEKQPLFPRLREHCEIRYVDIRDIIFHGNHSATLTVALERGMREMGKAMLNTYFIYLVADYLFASQSLSGLLPYLRKGVSAITAGNYQVVEEEVLDELKHFIDPATGAINIPNRELVGWSLRHLHPITVANTLGVGDTYSSHANRLFWRVDKDTLLGRFYLRHMLCIKPEKMDYVIGASCDYSYVEEMCPSGNVVNLCNSDEYLVIELQPLLHEGKFIEVGKQTPQRLASSLAEWTTATQRANAHTAMLFHAGDIPATAAAAREESKRYIEGIEAAMPPTPAPVRGHFYWRSCIQWITAESACHPEKYSEHIPSLRKNIWESPVFGPPLKAAGVTPDLFPPMRDVEISLEAFRTVWLIRRYIRLFGHPPAVRPWHPHFFDYQLLSEAFSRAPGPTLLILPPKWLPWIEWGGQHGFELRNPLIVYRDPQALRAELKDFSSCVICLPEEYDSLAGALFNCLQQALPQGSTIHIFVKPSLIDSASYSLKHIALRYSYLGQKPGIRFIGQRTYRGRVRRFMDKYLSETADMLLRSRSRPLKFLWCGAQLGLLHLLYAVHNLIGLVLRPLNLSRGSSVCSAVLTFRVEP